MNALIKLLGFTEEEALESIQKIRDKLNKKPILKGEPELNSHAASSITYSYEPFAFNEKGEKTHAVMILAMPNYRDKIIEALKPLQLKIIHA